MHAADDFFGIDDSAFDVLVDKITTRIGREISVEGEIAGFGGDENFLPCYFSLLDQPRQGNADIPFGPLVPVVDGRVQHVDAGSRGQGNCFRVGRVRHVVRFAEIRS